MVIVPIHDGEHGPEERLEITRVHAEALLDVCPAKIGYERTRVVIGDGREVRLDHFITASGTLDLLTVASDERGHSEPFRVPAWFGPEVTGNPAYEPHVLGFHKVPSTDAAQLTDEALDALLTMLVEQHGFGQREHSHDPEERTRDAFRRLTLVVERLAESKAMH